MNRENVLDLYEVRLALEPAAAAKAAINHSDRDMVTIRRALAHFRVACASGLPVGDADLEFHQAVSDASGNSVFAAILEPISDVLARARQATGLLPGVAALAQREHEEIATAIESRSSRNARSAMAKHIRSAISAVGQLPMTQ